MINPQVYFLSMLLIYIMSFILAMLMAHYTIYLMHRRERRREQWRQRYERFLGQNPPGVTYIPVDWQETTKMRKL